MLETEHWFRAYDFVTYDQVKTALSESQAEAEEWTNDNVGFWALRMIRTIVYPFFSSRAGGIQQILQSI